MNVSLTADGSQAARPFRNHRGVMARSRRMKRRPILLGLGGGLLFTGILTLVVGLSNGVYTARREIEHLKQEKTCVESEVAKLAVEWNRESSRSVIMDRAEKELGLVPSRDPGLSVVLNSNENSEDRSFWSRAAVAMNGAGQLVRSANAAENGR